MKQLYLQQLIFWNEEDILKFWEGQDPVWFKLYFYISYNLYLVNLIHFKNYKTRGNPLFIFFLVRKKNDNITKPMRLSQQLMEVLGTGQRYLTANEVRKLVGAYAKRLLVSIYCQAQAKFQLQPAWVSYIIIVPIVRMNRLHNQPNLTQPGIILKFERNGLV